MKGAGSAPRLVRIFVFGSLNNYDSNSESVLGKKSLPVDMSHNLVITLIFVAVIAAVLWLRRSRDDFEPPETKPASTATINSFEAAPSLFVNTSETAFFHVLQNKLPAGYFLMSKVRLEDIIRVKSAISDGKIRWHLRNRVKSRHVDFLVINARGQSVFAIELDGKVHNTDKSKNADDLKNGLFKTAKIPFWRVKTGEDFEKVAEKIVQKFNVS